MPEKGLEKFFPLLQLHRFFSTLIKGQVYCLGVGEEFFSRVGGEGEELLSCGSYQFVKFFPVKFIQFAGYVVHQYQQVFCTPLAHDHTGGYAFAIQCRHPVLSVAGKAFHFDKMSAKKHPTFFHTACRQLSLWFFFMHELQQTNKR